MPPGGSLDRFDLYERCVQSPGDLVPVLRAIHGGEPTVLGEDFCGSGALSTAWVGRVEGGRAIAVDHDREVLRRLEARAGIEAVSGDVIGATSPQRHQADVIHAGNFSIGEWHTRGPLLGYLRHVRARLRSGGVFVCDLYGGETAFLTGRTDREFPAGDGRTIRYTWEQREADPLTGMVVNAMHFALVHDGRVERRWKDAFVYRWRLWGLAELRDAMSDAGFAATEVYARTPQALDESGAAYVAPITDPADLEDSFDVLVAARTGDRPDGAR